MNRVEEGVGRWIRVKFKQNWTFGISQRPSKQQAVEFVFSLVPFLHAFSMYWDGLRTTEVKDQKYNQPGFLIRLPFAQETGML